VRVRAIFTCPFCSNVVPNSQLTYSGPITCPSCNQLLRYSRWQLHLSSLIAIILSVGFCRWLGIEGFWLFPATTICWLPVFVVWDVIFLRIVTPKLAAYYPDKSDSDRTGLDLFPR
jgi:hypothetical protein